MGDLCLCGCGQVAGHDSRGRKRKYAEQTHILRHVCYTKQPGAVPAFTGRHHSAESKAKLSAAASVPRPHLRGERNGMYGRTGASNPNWRGGGAPERQRLYATAEGRAFLRTVRQRDNHRCVRCNSTLKTHVHHIRPWAEHPDGRLDPDNAILLCEEHHIAEHIERRTT
jgi:hypothetical protein